MVKNLSVKVGDTGQIPGPGGFHIPWDNSAHVPQPQMPTLQSPCFATREATAIGNQYMATRESPLLTAARESPCTAAKTQHSQKSINKNVKNDKYLAKSHTTSKEEARIQIQATHTCKHHQHGPTS